MNKKIVLLLALVIVGNLVFGAAQTVQAENKLGIWLWYLPDTKFSYHTSLADELKNMGVNRIYVKVNDEGADHYFEPCLDQSVVNAYKSRGLEVWGWGFNYPHSIDEQVDALYEAAKVGYEGYVMDVESDFESAPGKLGTLARELNEAKNKAQQDGYIDSSFQIYLSSFGNIMDHPEIRIGAADPYVDGYMPQTYLEVWGEHYMNNPKKFVQEDKKDYREAGATKPIHNIVSVEYGEITSSQINKVFQAAGPEASIWRVPRWNVDDSSGTDQNPAKQWRIINNVNWDMYAEEEPTGKITINYPQQIIKGKTVSFTGTAPDRAEKVVVSVDGWTLTDLSGSEQVDVNNGSYELNYKFHQSKKDRKLVVKAFSQGNLIAKTDTNIDVLTPSEAEKLTINYPDQITADEEIKFSGQAPAKAEEVLLSVDGWRLTDKQGNEKINIQDGQYQMYYSFQQAEEKRKLVAKAVDRQGNLIARTEKVIDVLPPSDNQELTINYPDEITVGKEIKFSGTAPRTAEKVIISVDGWPLTNESGSENIKVNNGSYELNYTFDQAEENRKLVVKAFDRQGHSLNEIKRTIDIQRDGDQDDGDGVIEGVPYLYQYYNSIDPSGSCQNTAAAMVLNYYGWDGDPDTISRSSFDTDRGQTPEGLQEVFNYYARQSGLDVRVEGHRYGSMSDLNQLLAAGKPVIVHGWFTSYGHVITLVGYDGTYYYANDPAGKWNQNYRGSYTKQYGIGKYVKYHKSNVRDAVYDSDGTLWYHELYFVD